MWSATGISFPRSLQSLLSLDKLQKCPGRALGNLLCLALLGMQSTLSSREVQVHVLLFTCFLSCERGDLTMKSFPLHWWKCPTGSQDQINADPCIVYILQHKSLYNQSSFIWLDRRLRKLPFIRLHFKWSAFQYLWNLGNVQLLPWVWALFIVFYIALSLSLFYIIVFLLCCQVKVFQSFMHASYPAHAICSDFTLIFNFICSDTALMQLKPWGSVQVLLLYTAVQESRLMSGCCRPSVSGTSAIHSTASFKKSSFWPLCSACFLCWVEQILICFSFFFVSYIFIKYLIKTPLYYPKLN